MENIYNGGKIYKITNPNSEKYYIGSTTKTLNKRFSLHKSYYKMFKENKHNNKLTVFDLFDLGECSISLLENFPCNTKKELLEREGQIIRQYKDNLLNKVINGRTKTQYYRDNPEKINKIKLKWAMKRYDCDKCLISVQCGNRYNHEHSLKHISKVN
jgi:predicted GIY-YIG superfamily endonuclease